MWNPTRRRQHSRAGLRYGSDLTPGEWAILGPFLPVAAACGRKRAYPMREIVNAICYVLRGGIAWRLMPDTFPPWRNVYRWFSRLRDDGTWETINHHLVMRDRERVGREASPTAAVMDNLRRHSIAFGNGTLAFSARASRRPKAEAFGALMLARRLTDASGTRWSTRTVGHSSSRFMPPTSRTVTVPGGVVQGSGRAAAGMTTEGIAARLAPSLAIRATRVCRCRLPGPAGRNRQSDPGRDRA